MRFVVIGGGPAGTAAASTAARLGAEVVLVERDVIGGAANLWDCVPSKALIATGALVSRARRAESLGLSPLSPSVDLASLATRVREVEDRLAASTTGQLESQGVRIVFGSGRLAGPHQVALTEIAPAGTDPAAPGPESVIEADAILVATGSSPRVPDWVTTDGERVLTTRQAYPPPVVPEHLVIVGSGVTGVEFVHMFSSLGSAVTLIVSRQQVLPQKDPEVAAALEADFIARGVRLLMGARAVSIERNENGVVVGCDDGRLVEGEPCAPVHRLGPLERRARARGCRREGGQGRSRAGQPPLPVKRGPHLRRR